MNRRASERITTNLNAHFSWDNQVSYALVVNLSENGMCMNTSTYLPFESELEIVLPSTHEELKVPITVKRIEKTYGLSHSIGVEILHLPKRYSEYVDSLRWKPLAPLPVAHQTMDTFVCSVCRHITFEEAPFCCPFCRAPIESFEKKEGVINIPADHKNLSEFEKQHVPVITALKEFGHYPGCGHIDVHIEVGEMEHTMHKSDHISFIDMYFADIYLPKRCITRINFMCKKIKPIATVRFENITSGIFTVINHCNAHGSWMAQAKL
jgi:desulfoferrodoxin-like iron-binding protein